MAMLASPKQLSLKIAPREETKNHKTMEALLVNITAWNCSGISLQWM